LKVFNWKEKGALIIEHNVQVKNSK